MTLLRFSFRPLTVLDLPRLHAWMHAPHARETFGHWTLAEVTTEYGKAIEGREPFHAHVIEANGAPFGMMSWCRFRDSPEMRACYEVEDSDAVNCDVLLGEMAHRGRRPDSRSSAR